MMCEYCDGTEKVVDDYDDRVTYHECDCVHKTPDVVYEEAERRGE